MRQKILDHFAFLVVASYPTGWISGCLVYMFTFRFKESKQTQKLEPTLHIVAGFTQFYTYLKTIDSTKKWSPKLLRNCILKGRDCNGVNVISPTIWNKSSRFM